MSVIIKYQLKFPEVELKVSNDLFSGEFILDADITATTVRGAAGSTFEIKLYDLPKNKAGEIDQRLLKKEPIGVQINLGYFGGPFGLVMEGAVTSVVSVVADDKLVTTVKGEELAKYALSRTKPQTVLPDKASAKQAITQLLEEAKKGKIVIAQTPELKNISEEPIFTDKSWREQKVIEVLNELAESVGAELLVADKKVWMGKPIANDSYDLRLEPEVNLASFQPFTKEIPEETELNILRPLPATAAHGFKFTITGDPKLRSGHKVRASVDGFDKDSAAGFRVHSLIHKLSTTAGYICQGIAVKAKADDNCRNLETAACEPSADKIAESLTRKTQAEQRRRPVAEIGQVKTYTAQQHRSTLYFGQRFERTETQPSLRSAVDSDEQKLLRNKPMVSPFAWHKCGLVAPVYAGMKALLTHNLALHDDALVTGFIWSEAPKIEPPKNKEGDWWLCLPIDFDTSKPPTDNTKATNDLIANNGKRVIEVKGLKITIGADKLANVGTRPSEGEDDEFLIEHKKAKIKIGADGNIEMTADSDGGVVFKITKSSIEIA
jgi:hypothetical protein